MRIKPFQAIYPNLDYITSADSFFSTVKTEYTDYYQSGFFHKAPQEGVYVYQIQKPHRTYTGIIACADIQDYIDGKIKRHENTLASKEQKQIQLILRRNATVKPILLAYPQVNEIDQWIATNIQDKTPFLDIFFDEEQQRHLFWEVRDGVHIQQIRELFAQKVPYTYIADGHHRTSSVALLNQRLGKKNPKKPYDLLLSVFFPSTELEILDFNRVVQSLGELSMTTFMAKLSQLCDIEILETAQKPTRKHELTMYFNREWFKLKWRPSVLQEYADQNSEGLLDANLLNEKVMGDILGVEDVRTDVGIKYIEGPKGLHAIRSAAIKNNDSVAFCLYPVELQDLISVADADRVMPPKSTWFEPRIKNGLMVQEF